MELFYTYRMRSSAQIACITAFIITIALRIIDRITRPPHYYKMARDHICCPKSDPLRHLFHGRNCALYGPPDRSNNYFLFPTSHKNVTTYKSLISGFLISCLLIRFYTSCSVEFRHYRNRSILLRADHLANRGKRSWSLPNSALSLHFWTF